MNRKKDGFILQQELMICTGLIISGDPALRPVSPLVQILICPQAQLPMHIGGIPVMTDDDNGTRHLFTGLDEIHFGETARPSLLFAALKLTS
jgi:hypothetical protein